MIKDRLGDILQECGIRVYYPMGKRIMLIEETNCEGDDNGS